MPLACSALWPGPASISTSSAHRISASPAWSIAPAPKTPCASCTPLSSWTAKTSPRKKLNRSAAAMRRLDRYHRGAMDGRDPPNGRERRRAGRSSERPTTRRGYAFPRAEHRHPVYGSQARRESRQMPYVFGFIVVVLVLGIFLYV